MMDLLWLHGEGPGDIPSLVYRHLVTVLNISPDSLSGLRSVQKSGLWEGRLVTFVRIFNPLASEAARQVRDYPYLDDFPDLILYEGYWEGDSGRVLIESRAGPEEPTTKLPWAGG